MAQERHRLAAKITEQKRPKLAGKKLPADKGIQYEKKQKRLNGQLLKVAGKGNAEKVKRLLELGADINAKDSEGFTALMFALNARHTDIAMFLIGLGADVHGKERGMTPLMIAASYGYIGICELLIGKGADIGAEDQARRTAYDWAKIRFEEEMVDFLIYAKRLVKVTGKDGFRTFLSDFRACAGSA